MGYNYIDLQDALSIEEINNKLDTKFSLGAINNKQNLQNKYGSILLNDVYFNDLIYTGVYVETTSAINMLDSFYPSTWRIRVEVSSNDCITQRAADSKGTIFNSTSTIKKRELFNSLFLLYMKSQYI